MITAHFIYGLWDDAEMPEKYQANLQAWTKQGWNVRVWNREQVEKLVHDEYPQYWAIYQNLSRPIQKSDLARYIIVYHFGGFYFDLDCEPKPAMPLLTRIEKPPKHFIAFYEVETTAEFAQQMADRHPIRRGIPERHGKRLANYAFGGPPKHPALILVMELLIHRCTENPVIRSDYDVLYTTGPDVFTEALAQEPNMQRWEHKRFFIHQCSHSWKKPNHKRLNP